MRAPHPSPSITLVTVPHGGLSAFGGDTVGRDADAGRIGLAPPEAATPAWSPPQDLGEARQATHFWSPASANSSVRRANRRRQDQS
jgi:hypothetical protein